MCFARIKSWNFPTFRISGTLLVKTYEGRKKCAPLPQKKKPSLEILVATIHRNLLSLIAEHYVIPPYSLSFFLSFFLSLTMFFPKSLLSPEIS